MPTDQINTWFDKFDNFITAAVPDIVAETAVEHFRENFQRESFDGQGWQPLSPKYAKKKTRSSSRILTRTGALQASIRPDYIAAERVRISAGNARVKYARVHNEGYAGSVFVPAHLNRNFMGKGKQVNIRAHNRFTVVPRRQFMGRSAPLHNRITNRIKMAYDATK